VVVEGRDPGVSVGMSMRELAQLLGQLGAYDAMAFDGGGSATMYVAGRVVAWGRSARGNIEERQLANVLAVLYEPGPGQ